MISAVSVNSWIVSQFFPDKVPIREITRTKHEIP